MADIKIPKIHPGGILREEYLVPYGLTAGKLAKRVGVPRSRIERLASEKTPVTADTAHRLAAAFDTTPNFWMNMQNNYDLIIGDVDVSSIEPATLMYG